MLRQKTSQGQRTRLTIQGGFPRCNGLCSKAQAAGLHESMLGNKQGMAHLNANKTDAHGEDAKIIKVKAMSCASFQG